MNKINKRIITGGGSLLALTILLAASSAFAAGGGNAWGKLGRMSPPAVVGTVTGVSGTSLTVTGKNSQTYTVDASSAAVFKPSSTGNATSSVSAIASGDTVAVFGNMNGTAIIATRIIDGPAPTMMGKKGGAEGSDGKRTPPVVFGTVAGINGTNLTVTGKDGKTYTVDAVNSKISKPGIPTATVANIASGDTVVIFGTVNGTSVTATQIMDGPMMGAKGKGNEGKMGTRPALTGNRITGSVTAINGTSFTLTTKGRTVKTITVNDASATFTKDGQASSLGNLAVGQMVNVQGSADSAGTTITAVKVNIVTPSIRFTGTVQSVSGSTLTVLATNSTTYSVDTISAKVSYAKGQKGTVSIIQVGDKVSVSGKLPAGTNNVTASMIRDLTRTQ